MFQSDQYCTEPQFNAPNQATWVDDDLYPRLERAGEELPTNRSPAGLEHHWPYVVGDAYDGQNSMGFHGPFIGSQGSVNGWSGPQGAVNGWSQSATPNVFDERVDGHDDWPVQGYQPVERQQVSENSNVCGYQPFSDNNNGHCPVGSFIQGPHDEHNDFIYHGRQGIEPEESLGNNNMGFQTSVQITPPLCFSNVVNFSDKSPIHISEPGNPRAETVAGTDTSKNLHAGGRQPTNFSEQIKYLSAGKGLDENMPHIFDPTLHTDPFLMSNLLMPPASTYDHHAFISSAGTDPQSLLQQPGPDFGFYPQETVAVRPVPRTQPHISNVDMHRGEENDPHNANIGLPTSSHMYQHLDAYQFHSYPPTTPQSRETGNGIASQQQPRRPHRNKYSTPIRTPDPNMVLRGQSTPDLQHSVLNGFNEDDQLLSARKEQASKLRAESVKEIQLHLKILTSYFSHVRRRGLVHISPVHAAAQHWIECAKRWEGEVPEEWKAQLPRSPPQANAIQGMLYRQIRVQVMIETERREDTGFGSQLPDDDIHITAFREQLKLMKTWTVMFSNILDELQFNFPLLEDTW